MYAPEMLLFLLRATDMDRFQGCQRRIQRKWFAKVANDLLLFEPREHPYPFRDLRRGQLFPPTLPAT